MFTVKGSGTLIKRGSEILSFFETQDLDFSNEATEQLTCTYNGDPLTIGFNAKFLIEMLNVLESDEIKIELSSPTRAGILHPSESADGVDILMLVMPVMMSH